MLARRLGFSVVCAVVGVLVFASVAMALAPAPETPDIAKAEPVGARSATLRGVLSPGAPGEAGAFYFFVYTTGNECEGLGVDTTARQVSDGAMGEAVQAEVSGLSPDTTYTYCVASLNSEGEGFRFSAPEIFRTSSGPPLVEGQESASIGSSEATLSAVVSPGGLPTSVRVEYGPTASYGSSTTGRELAGSGVSVSEQVRLQGLTPSSQYHYRFVASNSKGTSDGVDMTFTTPQALVTSALGLPDGRSYELVSSSEDVETYVPKYKEELGESGSEIFGETGQYRASVDGNAVAYGAEPPASGVGGTGSTGPGYGNQYLSTRTATGWRSEDIESGANAQNTMHFEAFSDDLSLITISTGQSAVPSPTPAPPATCKSPTAYARDAEGFHALVTESPEPARCEAIASAGISADDAHLLLSSPEALTPHAVSGAIKQDQDIGNLYDSVGRKLYQVNVLPGGEPEQHPDATFGGNTSNSESELEENDFLSDVSSDGSRVFWTDLNTEVTPEDPAGTTRLFVRENDTHPQSPLGPGGECTDPLDACSVQLDAKQGGAGQGGGGVFAASSSDGSLVLFTDGSRLTADSKATAERPDLYEFDLETGVLSDLTPGGAGVSADVRGVIGASEDGSYVYFVAKGKLVSTPNGENKEPVAEQPNLYLVHQGVTTFIGTLEQGDDTFNSSGAEYSYGTSGDWYYHPSERDTQVSANGQAVGFMSRVKLTGYDNYGVRSPSGPEYADLPEVFVYEVGTGRISCVSCNPDGAPPVPSHAGWEDGFNSYVPVSGEVSGTNGGADFMPRWINASGSQVYFMSNQPLVASDTNRFQDVYEWESNGSGGCGQASGCIAPISSVTTPGAAYLVDASTSGDDVFFTQRADLVPGASNENVKLYDARVGGGFPESSVACVGTGCQGVPPAPPIFATPSSVTFAGVGDFEPSSQTGSGVSKRSAGGNAKKLSKALRACRRRSGRVRAGCERKARKRYPLTAKRGKR